MKTLCVPGCVLLSLTLAVQPAAPPDKGRKLTTQEKKEVALLKQAFKRNLNANEYEEAVRTAKQIADYRAERQGGSHWEAIDARWDAKTWQRPAQECAELLRAGKIAAEGRQLKENLRYREAEVKLREALAIYQKVLGEQHPETATTCNNVAFCLNAQGKHAEALALDQKALAIKQKILGEQHPETATSYNNVALSLNDQGKHAEALPLLQKALALRQKVLGEQDPETAASYNNLAGCLNAQGKHAEALPLFEKALAIKRKVLGEQDADTATSYNNVASCLNAQGKRAMAYPLYQKALAIHQKVLGEQHPDTATSYNNLAGCLDAQFKHAEALPLHQKAFAINRKVLGEQHPSTAISYNNVSMCLNAQGKHVEALPLCQKALAIRQKVLGEQHPDTAASYGNVGMCLNDQGKHAEALPLCMKALAIRQKTLGEQHPNTADSYNSVALCLHHQGKHAEALPVFQKALAIRQKTLGEQHPSTTSSFNNVAACLAADEAKRAEALPLLQKALANTRKVRGEEHSSTATSYNNLAGCLHAQGKHAEALPLYQQALAINQKVLGQQHPGTALSCNNVAVCLSYQRKHSEALPVFLKALAIRQNVLGEQHPHTAQAYNNVAFCLCNQGKYADARRSFEAGLLGHEFGRLKAACSGFERSLFRADDLSPRAALAVCMVRLDKPLQAWEHAESDFARGLLDDLLPSSDTTADTDKLGRLSQLDQALIPLLTLEKLSAEQTTQRDTLAKERDDMLAEMGRIAATRSRKRVLPFESIQKQIPADAAVAFWLDIGSIGQHLGCILRREGPPVWVKLLGSGKDNAWNDDDDTLPDRAMAAMSDGSGMPETRKKLLDQLHRQRIIPFEPHLKGVRHLLVVPAGRMSAVPVEALTERYLVSYIPSASVYARRMEKHRPLEASSLLVLADPVFTRTAPRFPAAPPHGLLVKAVTPGSVASRIGLVPGDVLLEYDGKKLIMPDDLKPAADEERVPIKLWREGKEMGGRVPAGNLGAVVDRLPIAEALSEWRKQESRLLNIGRGGEWSALPGTQLEARTLATLVPGSDTLVGSKASEKSLDELAKNGKLKDYRLLHFATHGEANTDVPESTALILSQDDLPTLAEAAALVLKGESPPEGKLTVARILKKDWEIDADLVVLSACKTGLGRRTSGDGMLGFTHALMQKGARSVVLSRWKVDDAATSLLMVRFYENLLGKREGLKESMKRAEALQEAKSWLRTLSRADAQKRFAALVDGVPRGERGSIKAALPTRKPGEPKGDDHPFAAPYYWAAFVLLGDPH